VTATDEFRAARDFLVRHQEDYDEACQGFRWPELERFNWALDWFDVVAATEPTASRRALWIVEEDGRETRRTFAEMSARSNQVANWLRGHGVARGDRLILMLGNQGELWETILAAMKLGAVIIPASTLLAAADLRDRVDRGQARHVVARAEDTAKFTDVPGDYTRIAVGAPADGWW
jgi:acetyl-CoA synthetase